MGIMVSKDDEKSELDRRITADLRVRAQQQKDDDIDYVDDSAYIEGTKKTGKYSWVWLVLIALAILALLLIVLI